MRKTCRGTIIFTVFINSLYFVNPQISWYTYGVFFTVVSKNDCEWIFGFWDTALILCGKNSLSEFICCGYGFKYDFIVVWV